MKARSRTATALRKTKGSHSLAPRSSTARHRPAAASKVEQPPIAGKAVSKAAASSKLLLLIVAYGAGMAIFTLIVLRWITAFLQNATN